jgi:hypothetical protein
VSTDSDRAWLRLNGARAALHTAVDDWQNDEGVGVPLTPDVAHRLHEANAARRAWDDAAAQDDAAAS